MRVWWIALVPAVIPVMVSPAVARPAALNQKHAPDEIVDSAPFQPPPGQPRQVARIDLSKPFNIPGPAILIAKRWPAQMDELEFESDPDVRPLRVCIQTKVGPCSPQFRNYRLDIAELVYPKGLSKPPLIHLQIAGLSSPSGHRGHSVIMLNYRRALARFDVIFDGQFGSNNNQDIRYVASGPLRGDMISAEPTDNAPYGFWIAVNQLTAAYRYRQVLRYRSATHYGDGNLLAVIDSEMPNILRRLGLWQSGQPLPLPKSGCAKPRLVKSELWCS